MMFTTEEEGTATYPPPSYTHAVVVLPRVARPKARTPSVPMTPVIS